MGELKCTPWFHVQEDGLPVRPGVYEGTAVGKPGGSYVINMGFYLWDGIRWVGFGEKPDAIRRGTHRVSYWRGVIPGADYPFEQVVKPQMHYSGVLERAGALDRLNFHRLTVKGDEMVVAFTRERGGREPEKYDLVLHRTGNEFTGSSKIRIGDFTTDQTAQMRVPSFVESDGRLTMSWLLQGSTPDWHSFHGTLANAR